MSVRFSSTGQTAERCRIYSGPPTDISMEHTASFAALTSVGGEIDGVTSGGGWYLAHPGGICTVEASAAFAVGTVLATIADGRVRTAATGEMGVLRALEAAAGAGSIIRATFTHGNKV